MAPAAALQELQKLEAARVQDPESLAARPASDGKSVATEPDTSAATPAEVPAAPSVTEFEPKFPDSPHESLDGYLDLFTDEKRGELEGSILAIETSAEDSDHALIVAKAIEDTYGGYHSIKGAARTVGGVLTEHLVHQSEDLLSFFKRFWAQLPEDRLSDLITINLKVLDVIWMLREQLHESGSEEEFWENESDRFKFLSLVQSLASQLEVLEGLGLKVDVEGMSSLF